MTWDWHWFVLPGSALFVFPLTVLLGLPLLADAASRRAVLAWWAALAAAAALTAASKIAFYGWGTGIRAWDLTCFSGHTVLAMGFWPVALALFAPVRRPALRRTLAAAGWVLGALIGISREAITVHPWSEVIAGALLGGAVGLIGLRTLRGHALPTWWPALLLAATLVAGVLRLDRQIPQPRTERWFADSGAALAGNEKPVNRYRWRAQAATSP